MRKKIYLITLILGLFSLALSAGLITVILKDNAYLLIDPAQDLYQLEVLDSQKLALQLSASLPSLIFLINAGLALSLYHTRAALNTPSGRYSLIWIVLSIGYQCLTMLESRWGFGIEMITILLMAGTWLMKAAACRALFRELKSEKPASKGVLCVN